jgi:hypothetical protein
MAGDAGKAGGRAAGRATGRAEQHGRRRTPPAPTPAPLAVPSFHTPVRGYAFAAVPPPAAAVLEPGTEVLLLREPGNPADPMAVAVWLTVADRPTWRLGYLDRTVASRLAPRLDAGAQVRAELDGWVEEPNGRWRRPLLHLELKVPEQAEGGRLSGPVGRGDRSSLRRQPPGSSRRRVRRRDAA